MQQKQGKSTTTDGVSNSLLAPLFPRPAPPPPPAPLVGILPLPHLQLDIHLYGDTEIVLKTHGCTNCTVFIDSGVLNETVFIEWV